MKLIINISEQDFHRVCQGYIDYPNTLEGRCLAAISEGVSLKNTLVDLQLEIEENVLADDPDTLLPFLQARETCVAIIQQKIKKLKGDNKC